MNEHRTSDQNVELWRRELAEAGWVRVRWDLYRDPQGFLHRGPYAAWCLLKGRKCELPA